MIHVLGVIVNGHWRLGIGDPNFMGWLITMAYLITSMFCGIYAWRIDRISPVNRTCYHRAFWLSLAVIMLIMGINKQLDLQCLFIAVVKKIALTQGWYSQRRIFQMLFVAFVAVFGMIVLIWVGWKLKRLWRQYGLALFGILLLIIFVFVRATPVQYVAKSPGWRPVMRMINSVLELTSIGLIGIAALMGIIRGTKQTDRISES
jgi:hypothetical protein